MCSLSVIDRTLYLRFVSGCTRVQTVNNIHANLIGDLSNDIKPQNIDLIEFPENIKVSSLYWQKKHVFLSKYSIFVFTGRKKSLFHLGTITDLFC